MDITKEKINALTLAEKQQLLELIWDSLKDKNDYTVYDNEEEESPEELALLEERLAEYKRHPSTAMPWEQALHQLKHRI